MSFKALTSFANQFDNETMRIVRVWILFSVVLFASVVRAAAPTIGAEVSAAIAQQLLAGPPLPNLDGEGTTATAQIGYAQALLQDSTTVVGGSQFTYNGEVKGNTGGLALTHSGKSDLGFFLFAIGSGVKGDVQTQIDGTPDYTLKNITSDSYALAAGATYRLIGDAKSKFALGVLGGPAYVKIQSKLSFVPPSGMSAPTVDYTMEPTTYGWYQGLQFVLRMGAFRFNPYMVMMVPLSDSCQPIQTSDGTSANSMTCKDTSRTGHADFFTRLVGLGLFIGYGGFRVNVYSRSEMQTPYIRLSSYSASIGFSW